MPVREANAPGLRLADIFRRSVEPALRGGGFSYDQARALRRAAACRTPQLGGHRAVCTRCGRAEPRYHSCRDRHCPTCRAVPQAKWIAERERRLLPVGHFHVVFTLPAQLRPVAAAHPRVLYDLLMRSAGQVLKVLGQEVLGGRLGITLVLHTWTRELLRHPHVHCIVTGGVLLDDGSGWKPSRTGYLFPVRRMAAMFRGRILSGLLVALNSGEIGLPGGTSRHALLRRLNRKRWVVFAKRPFGRVEHLGRYLGRYTHRVAISDARVVSIDETGLIFRTRGGDTRRLDDREFLSRFARHVLPAGFRKIRHYGLYAPAAVPRLLPAARALIRPDTPDQEEDQRDRDQQRDPNESIEPLDMLRELTGFDPRVCKRCGAASLIREPLPRARDGPPAGVDP